MEMSNPVIIHSEPAPSSRAGQQQHARSRQCDTSRPTRIIEIMVPTPRGAMTMPVSITG